ncbi:MAG TPA: GAF domain-containing protein [Anaerolineae bacterium]|nr:GAF domain-containing protein [Anaerolineae bacterium]
MMSHPNILIVDDKPENLYALERLLQSLDVAIRQATSAAQALELSLKTEFCLAIVDVQMPEMDGYELVELLRSNEGTATLPVIFVSAIYSDEYHHQRGYEAGAVDFLSKPFAPDILLSKVKIFLDLYNQRQRLQAVVEQLHTTNTALSKRAAQLEVANAVGQQVISILNLEELLTHIVQQIQAKFGYYCVSVWLRAESHNDLILQAAAGQSLGTEVGGYRLSMQADPSIIAYVCRTREYYLSNDVLHDPHYMLHPLLPQTCAELALPLEYGRERRPISGLSGVLDIQSEQLNAFDAADITALQTLADQISIALRNAQLYKAEKQRRTLAETLEETGRILSSRLAMHEVPDLILEQLAHVVSYMRGAVMLCEEDAADKLQLRLAAQYGFPNDRRVGELRIPVQAGDVFDQLVASHRPLILDDVSQTPHWQQVDWLPINRSWLGVPLIAKNRVLGMISLTREEAAAFTPDDATVAATFAGQAAIALENARLYAEIVRFNTELEDKVTERTASLQKAYEQLELLDRKKMDFIQVVSHELRTPLTLIQGYGQILLRDPKLHDDETFATRVNGIVTGAVRMHEIVNSMLDLIRLDNRTWKLSFRPLMLTLVLGAFPQSLAHALAERSLTLTLDLPATLPEIEADYEALSKLFDHLICNAIKYTPDGGHIAITGRLLSDPAGEDHIEIVISDSGIGIAREVQELIFTKFYTTGDSAAHSTGRTKFKGGGPGLGLAIAKGIVEAHGGRIWVESPGYDEAACPGSQFHVVLPVKRPSGELPDASYQEYHEC